ncbi:WD40 repeat domain-containing protein [Streptomyces sp. CC228A]|uniref:WD40 repeat domain-containing protein n=1 Tax=Streptomyces sp. CC228A TaxID=2898186 RepID=UPI001F1AEFA2|nr:WD40 repeat domain-containing protein [Streptomyces sp. CC228A]
MELTDRVVRIEYVPEAGLLAADVTGRIHLLDGDLRVVRSSPAPTGTVVAGHAPVYTVTASGPWVVGRDKRGTLLRWRLDTLDLVDVLDADHTADHAELMEGEEPSPVMSRGITVHRGKVYVNNGYRQMAVLDLETFAVERVEPSFAEHVPLEWFCQDHPDVDAASDKAGRVFLGDLESLDFPTVVRADGGNIHRILYDPLHHRFWATQDDGTDENDNIANGVLTLDAQGTITHQVLLARDDVEFLAFSPDHRTVYVGGFDGVLHLLDNTAPEPRIADTVTGFSHQLTDFTVGDDGTLYTLTQDGDIRRLSADGREVLARAPFRRQCVWDIRQSADDPAELYAATDDGVAVLSVATDPVGEPRVAVRDHLEHGMGFTRRVVPLPGGWAGVTRDRWVFRATRTGEVLWRHRVPALPHTVSGSPDHSRLLACHNDGVDEIDAATGEVVARLDIGRASAWAGCYLPGGERVVASSTGLVTAFAADRQEVLWELDTTEYPKRMWAEDADTLIVSGENGLKRISVTERKVTHRWTELLDNTVENGVLLPDRVYAVSYGAQLGVYERESTEILGLVEDLPDFAKAVAAVPFEDGHVLLVGGRGGWIRVFRTGGEAGKAPLTRVRDLLLPRQRTTP